MPLAAWQATIVDGSGTVQASASVEVKVEASGALAALFSDRDGATPLDNPIEADVNGFVRFYTAGGAYKITATLGAFSREWRHVPVGLLGEFDEVDSANIRYDDTLAEVAAGVTPLDYSYPERNLLRYSGITADGVTDCTTAILTVCNAMGGLFTIPYNVFYNRETLLSSLDSDVLILDLSRINNLNSPGETAKRIGIISSDEAVSDSMWAIESGHHPVLSTNNFGTSGTTSGDKRLATWVWSAGQFSNTTLPKRGDRGAAQLQFGKDSGAYWSLRLVSFAPWVAIADTYEAWKTAEVISGAGIYRLSSTGRHYVSTGAGTTGVTEPTHATGTVSDGGVSWTYVDDRDRGVWDVDEFGRVLVGNGSAGRTYYHKVAPTDPGGGGFSAEFEATGVSKVSDFRLTPTTSGSAASAQPFLRAQDGVGLRFMNSGATADLARISDADGLEIIDSPTTIQRVTLTYSASIATNAALGSTFIITATNGTAFAISQPSGAKTGRRIRYTIRNTSGGALGVVTWSAAFKMATWTSPATGFSRSIDFEYDGTNWIEACRATADVPN